MTRARLLEAAAVIVGALLLAVLTTWPLALSLDDRAHDQYDTLSQAWTIDWVQHSLASADPLWDANIFHDSPRSLAYTDSLIGPALVLLPARWLGLSPIGVLNVGLLLAYASSAAAGYVFGKAVTRRAAVAVVVGVVFAFGTSNTFLAQHFNIALHPGPALAAAAVWLLADRRSEGQRVAPTLVALALVVALQGSASFNTAAITLLAAVAAALGRWRDLGLRGLGLAAGASAAGLAALLPLAWPYFENSRSSGALSHGLRDFGTTGASFTTVDPSLWLWGDALATPTGLFGRQPVFPGVVLLVLAVYGLLLWGRAADRRAHVFAVTFVLVGLVAAIGTSDRGWRQYAPYRLVYELMPGGNALRATGRFWIVGLLGMGLLAGLAVHDLARRLAARASGRAIVTTAAVVGVAVGGILIEGHRSWTNLPKVAVPAVDQALATIGNSDDGGGGVLYLPVPTSGALLDVLPQAAVIYGTTAHHRRTPNGYSGYFPDSFYALDERVGGLPDDASLGFLRRLSVRYVVVPEAAGSWQYLRRPAAAAPLVLVGEYDGALLYELPDARPLR